MSHPIESIRLQVREITKTLIGMGLKPMEITTLFSQEAGAGMAEAFAGQPWDAGLNWVLSSQGASPNDDEKN